ncbi:TSUP family transporter, partial [Neptunomonas sp.]|uniref:TSUP family transporter n=1 Tax=Neptunomonas sp. TaxID=1971898 RepID=UPI0035647B1B
MDSAIFVLLGAGLITGFSKFSVGGMGMLILPVLMIAYTGPEALSILVPMYILTDLVVVALYRKEVNWGVLLRLLPLQMLGMVLGSWLLADISASVFSALIGSIIIGMLLLGWWLENHD